MANNNHMHRSMIFKSNYSGWETSNMGRLQHKQRACCHNADHMGDDVCLCAIWFIRDLRRPRQQNHLVQNYAR